MTVLLKGGIIVDPSQGLNDNLDLLIKDGIVANIGKNLSYDDALEMDIEGLHLVPGLVDIHVHFREPGFEKKETIATGAAAAIAGGFTTVVCMPNTSPAIDTAEIMDFIKVRGAETHCNIHAMGAITKGLKGNSLASFGELKAAGVVGITDDGYTPMNSGLLYHAMVQARDHGLVVSSHCEDANLVFDRSINAGSVAQDLGLKGVPSAAEEIIIQRDILIAEETGARLHIQHISSMKGVEMVRQAKARGVKVSAEAAPHHFSLTDEAVRDHGTNAKMSPPLRSEADRLAVREGLADGTIDVIATDHAPHTAEDKSGGLVSGANGIVGLETSLGLGIKYLVTSGFLSFSDLVAKMSWNPSRLLGLPGGTLVPGCPADITVVDLSRDWVVDSASFASKGRNTPFQGESLKGKAVMTIRAGEVVWSQGFTDGRSAADGWWTRDLSQPRGDIF